MKERHGRRLWTPAAGAPRGDSPPGVPPARTRRLLAALLLAVAAGAAHAQVYRTLDGVGNNTTNPTWGSAGIPHLREASGAHFGDGIGAPAGASRPSARLISNMLADQDGADTADARGLSTCVYEFGQFLDHDIGLARGGSAEPFHIHVPRGDPFFDPNSSGTQVIHLVRSAFDPLTGITTPRQQVNTITSFVDASQVYAVDPARAAWLRTGEGGHLKVEHQPFGDMLPHNDGTMPNDNPTGLPPTSMYVAGDVRANEQVGLTAFHVVFLREHNWQADRLHALNPDWDDEHLYQEARRFVGAEMQVIVYQEFLPAILGHDLPPYTGYHPDVNPGLGNAFATAAFRIGHSMVGDDIDLLDENFQETGIIELDEAFFNPMAIPTAGGIEPIVRYFTASLQQETDTMIVDPLRNFLFGPPGAGGFDLASLNIQRGRDHGLADYNTLRADYALPRVTSFDQITSDPALALALQDLYGDVDDIDPWVGMLAEDHLPGSSIGPTHTAIFTDQFVRMRDGDSLWYQIAGFSAEDLAMVEATRLSQIFARTTGITGLQDNVFFADLHIPCPADFDHNRRLDSDDFFAFLSAFFVDDPRSDFNADHLINSQDFFDYLTAFFTGC